MYIYEKLCNLLFNIYIVLFWYIGICFDYNKY